MAREPTSSPWQEFSTASDCCRHLVPLRPVALLSTCVSLMAFTLLAPSAAAQGAALCQKKNGLVILRSQCKGGEQALGAVGEPGPTGPTGPPGPPGGDRSGAREHALSSDGLRRVERGRGPRGAGEDRGQSFGVIRISAPVQGSRDRGAAPQRPAPATRRLP